MGKWIFVFVAIILSFISGPQNIFAQEQKQVVLVNPIRGGDFWNHNFSLTETPKKQYELIKKNNFSSTWLVRFDALNNPEVQEFLKTLDPNQDIGIFLEITPSFATAAGVKYNNTGNWHYAKSVLLTGYSPDDRKKLIDIAFSKFKEVTGRDAKSVGAWWIDAGSLSYMKEKYQIEANLDVADQYSTDGYQVWGQYWSTPFYPSKVNALMPAQSKEQKLGVVTMQWATRDPFNGYGNGVFESTYSVQANDYLLHNLGTDYFAKLLDIYPQTTVGLENDFPWNEFGKEFENQISVIKDKSQKGQIQVKNMLQFANYYMKANPGVSPNVVIEAEDPLGSTGKVVWVNNPKYRAAWFSNSHGSVIRDLRKFGDTNEEGCLEKACDELKLAFEAVHVIDDGNYSSSWILDEGSVSDVKTQITPMGANITYKNQSGVERLIKFLENDIEFAGQISTFDVAILKAVTKEGGNKLSDDKFESKFEFNTNLNTILTNGLKFILVIILFFFIPGFALIKRKLLAIPLGLSIFTLLAWVFGILKMDYLVWGLPIISAAWMLKSGIPKIELPKLNRESLILSGVVLLGSASWMITQFKNGLLFNYGFGFWGPNGHDAIWHLALISELQKNVPPENPIFAGINLSNYHYFFDLLVAKSANLLNINSVELLFRLFPILISILAGLLIFQVTKKIVNSSGAGIFAVFFLYFGGSFGWILTFLKDGAFAGETMFWAQQSISTLLNPPFAISVVLFLAGLLLFYELIQKQNDRWNALVALIILWGLLIEFKAYAGILALGAYGLFTAQRILLKRDFSVLLGFLPTLILSLIVFLPNNLGSQSLIEFQPLWLIQSMINSADRLGWQRLTLAIESGLLYKLIYGYGLGILIFLVGNFGTRIISLGALKLLFKQSFLVYFIALSIILPLLFVQKGTAWNIVQFFYYGLLVLNIFAGIGLYNLFRKTPKFAGIIVVVIIMVLTIPTTLGTFQHYLPSRPPAKVSQKELEALDFLNKQSPGVVLSLPYDEKLKGRFDTPLPLSVYSSTAYVSAFSKHDSFMEDTVNLEILGIDYKGRLNTIRDFMKIRNQSKQILKDNNISYVYIPKFYNFQVDEGQMGLKTIYENDEVKIYKAE